MALYGIYGEHTQAACPLYNKETRRELLSLEDDDARSVRNVKASLGSGIFNWIQFIGVIVNRSL